MRWLVMGARLVIAIAVVYFAGSPAFGMLLLTFGLGMAIAGPGRRIYWAIAALALLGALALGLNWLTGALKAMDGNVALGVATCALMPLLPAGLFWLAAAMRRADGAHARTSPATPVPRRPD